MILRAAGILIENNKLLLIDQDVTSKRRWSLPGGKLEEGEKLGDCVIREVEEETGLKTQVKRLLYICDSIKDDTHIVHITFQIERIGGTLGNIIGTDTNKIRGVQFIPLSELVAHGFGEIFQELAMNNFPNAGVYMGEKKNIGL
jgi:ADP-ribose pyrophosphatase YjhB (NUDIX family)